MPFSDIFLGAAAPSHFSPAEFDWLPAGYTALSSSYKNSYGRYSSLLTDYAEFHAVRAYHAGGNLMVADGEIAFFTPRNSTEVARWLKVGSHNDSADPDEVASLLEMTHRDFPLAAYFADPAGYKARLLNPVDMEAARMLADRFSFNYDAWSLAESFDLPYPEFIFASQTLQLWWD